MIFDVSIKHDPHSIETKRAALAGLPNATILVIDNGVDLRDAVRDETVRIAGDKERVTDAELSPALGPSWYLDGRRIVGQTMRRMGYAKRGDVWVYGATPLARRAARKHGLRLGEKELRRATRWDLERLYKAIGAELDRRGVRG